MTKVGSFKRYRLEYLIAPRHIAIVAAEELNLVSRLALHVTRPAG